MNRRRRYAARGFLCVVGFGAMATLTGALPLGHASRGVWRRVFYDDFRHGLRASHWGVYSGAPGGDSGGWWTPSHAYVAHGVLTLDTYRDPRYGGRWVSAGVSSAPGLRQTYGKYLIRARMTRGKGVAFVALLWPVRNVWPPEVDFVENGGETAARRQISATLHYGSGDDQIQRSLRVDLTRWHTFGVEWTPGQLRYTVDGRQWGAVRASVVPDQPMEMDIQTQAGTCGDPFAPCPDAHTPAHVRAQITWVSAWAYQGRRPRG